MSIQTSSLAAKGKEWGVSRPVRLVAAAGILFSAASATVVVGQSGAHDPGVRGGAAGVGAALKSVASTPGLPNFFNSGQTQFAEDQTIKGDNIGLGPRFNSNSCGSCHLQPAVGGTSPAQNPQVQFVDGVHNALPSFITSDGPTREARFKYFLNHDGSLSHRPDGGVHDLFVITGLRDAGTCAIKQPDFDHNLELNNVIFRIPTPVFGAGLIENISDETILSNMRAHDTLKDAYGISGHPNRNGNDGTITRFGWKAQNKSLEIFAGEAYNVEMGVSNELFPSERPNPDEAQQGGLPGNCLVNPTPEDTTHFTATTNSVVPSDVVQFAIFMRLLAPPTPSADTPGGAASIARGNQLFVTTGCALCHTPKLRTAQSSLSSDLSQADVNLLSDLLVHHMGENLADGVSQGNAGPDEFRTAPLWGLGQRIFFLHDGRTRDLVDAIRQHASDGSEANQVIHRFHRLLPQQQQDLLNFLRSL
jgi:CxxC motif-containing protein (DUF1111 family)